MSEVDHILAVHRSEDARMQSLLDIGALAVVLLVAIVLCGLGWSGG